MIRPLLCALFLAGSAFAQKDHDHGKHAEHAGLMATGTKEEIRTWHVRDGRKISGVLVNATKDQLLLEREGGRKLKVPLRMLSDADQLRAKTWGRLLAAPANFGTPGEEIVIKTVFEQMKYDVNSFTVSPGSKVRLLLINEDQMAHNLILLQPGTDVEMAVAQKAWALGDDAMKRHWIPEDDRIIAHTRMVGGFLSQAIHFTAPTKPGDYPYICSLPGHIATMKGVMTVSDHKPGLNSLTYAYYTGNWSALPDFSKLTPAATGRLEKNLIDIKPRKTNDRFAFVFEGNLVTAKKGAYTFHIGSDDGSSLEIDGKMVVKNDGIHGVQFKSGKVNLEAGLHKIRVAYFEGSGGEELHVGWDGPGFKNKGLSQGFKKGGGGSKGGGASGIPILVENDEASMYRNFILGGGTRGIGVGYPGEVNLCYDADNMFISLIWLGSFMDGAKHWNGRGQGFQPPAGNSVQKLVAGVPIAELSSPSTPWPSTLRKSNEWRKPEDFRFKGYVLNEKRYPVFTYTWNGLEVRDFPQPGNTDPLSDEGPSIKRTIQIKGSGQNLYYRAATGAEITPSAQGFEIDGAYAIKIENAKANVRESEGKKELLVKLDFQAGSTTFTQHYTWLHAEGGE